jgi:hypothetical protein
MGNKWDEMNEAYKEAEATINSADYMIADMARMVSKRLRQIDMSWKNINVLIKLKTELRNFNIQTKQWKKR